VKRFRGGLVFNAHRLLYPSTLGLRVIKKKRRSTNWEGREGKREREKERKRQIPHAGLDYGVRCLGVEHEV